MNSKEEVKSAVREAVMSVTGITDLNDDASLIDGALGIAPADFLYIFDTLEKGLRMSVHDVLITNGYQVMSVINLTDAIHELIHELENRSRQTG